MIKSLIEVIKWILIIYLLLLIGLYFFQEKLIFHPEKLSQSHQYSLPQKFEEINIKTKDDNIINALHLKVDEPKGVILYFHGNAGSLERWSKIVSYYTQFNYDVFVFDYRGYGKSSGYFNEKKMYDDALLVYNYVLKHYKENEIIIYGRSLGATFATHVASKNQPKQLILEAPFYSLTDIAKKYYPIVPIRLLKYKFKTNKLIQKVTSPITIFHGTEDSVIPYENGKKLFDLTKNPKNEFITIHSGGHNDLLDYNLYKEKVKTLLN